METLIAFGSAIKTLSDDGETLRFGGHLVLFGGPDEHDATPNRDYFTKSTDFDLADGKGQSTIYYHHGLNPALKARPLGRAQLSVDDAGVWMEGELKARDSYEAKILEMVRRGKLGLSSGTAVHLVERKAMPNSSGERTHEITRWPLGLDASFTPTPGEPRTMATAIKSLEEVEAWEDELTELKYSPDQPRNNQGEWSGGGGSSSVAVTHSHPGSEHERQKRGEHNEPMSHGDAKAEHAAAKEHLRQVKEKVKAHREKQIGVSLDMRAGKDRPDAQAIANEGVQLYNERDSAQARFDIAKARLEKMKGERKFFDEEGNEIEIDKVIAPERKSLEDHSDEVLDANSDYLERMEDLIVNKRNGKVSEKNAQRLTAFSVSCKALAAKADEIVAVPEEPAVEPELNPEDAKADPVEVKASWAKFVALNVGIVGA